MRQRRTVWIGITGVLLVLLAGALQMHRAFPVAGIRPNFILTALIVVSFFVEDTPWYLATALIASISIRFSGGWSIEALAIILIGIGVFFIKSKIVWPGVYGSAILIALSTLVLYAFIGIHFLFSSFGIVAAEILYNIALGFILYESLEWLTKRSARV